MHVGEVEQIQPPKYIGVCVYVSFIVLIDIVL